MTAGATTLRWSHVALNCTDQAATEAFYVRWFGFRRVRRAPLGGGGEILFLRRGEVLLELFAADGPVAASPGRAADLADGPARAGTVRHLAFQTDDLDDFLETAVGHLRVSLGPISFDGFLPGWRSVWVLDPDDVVVEVSQGYRDEAPPAPAAAPAVARTDAEGPANGE
ncbi:MAG: VOC family protein [Kineosporiaceae bacterium]